MNRVSRHEMWMKMAETAALRSTCMRANIGAILVRETNISIGYNGPPSGDPHCTGSDCAHPESGCTRSIHAEANAINRASFSTIQSYLYCTMSPCPACAHMIVSAGISRVFYRAPYRLGRGIEILHDNGIGVYRLAHNGGIIRELDNALLEEI